VRSNVRISVGLPLLTNIIIEAEGDGSMLISQEHNQSGEAELMEENSQLLEMTADIVSAYVGNNNVQATELPSLIANIHAALTQVSGGAPEPEPELKEPAVPVRKSITPDFLICLEDGRKFKSLKRHLRTKYNISPEEYRAKWGLPKDYPMVAPNYAKARSDLAKQMGLGQGGRKPARAPARAKK
jgi:predicted transcriptional regulator